MGWENFSVDSVDLTPKPIEPGVYTLQLTGAFENKFRPTSTDVSFVIADEGSTQRGKRVYLDLPDPDEQPWAGEVYARLIKNLGATVQPYAHPKDELNRLASNGHSRISAAIYTETFTRKDGTEGSKSRINSRSIRPAA